uniref:Uncharacterized protein n=1 Tax=Timema poppense TaxID=170557 RepID=A0A7R9H7P9_TIMPO|nr:unnamed protein product [Timema poppensis]
MLARPSHHLTSRNLAATFSPPHSHPSPPGTSLPPSHHLTHIPHLQEPRCHLLTHLTSRNLAATFSLPHSHPSPPGTSLLPSHYLTHIPHLQGPRCYLLTTSLTSLTSRNLAATFSPPHSHPATFSPPHSAQSHQAIAIFLPFHPPVPRCLPPPQTNELSTHTPHRFLSLFQKLLWLLLHPLLLLTIVVSIFTLITFPELPWDEVLDRSLGATKQALVFAIIDSSVYGNWVFSVATAILTPNWLIFWLVLNSKPLSCRRVKD